MNRDFKFIKNLCLCLFVSICFLIISQKAFSSIKASRNKKNKEYNIILISMDTLRYDHLSFAGYHRKTSPNIDKRLAKKGIVFSQAISQSNWTLPSNASLLSSQYVPRHNLDRAYKELDDSTVTLAEILNTYGYQTAAFTGGFHLSHIFGLDQGFQLYYDQKEHARLEDLLPLALDWLNSHKNDKFFLFLQANDSHAPFKLPKEMVHMYALNYNGLMDNYVFNYNLTDLIRGQALTDPLTGEVHNLTPRDIDYIIAQYDAAITYMDKQIGFFLKALRKLRLSNNTIIIFLGDHGEELMEHGGRILKRKHGDAYEEGIHIPLIIRHPGLKKMRGKIIENQVQLIDVAPTILDFLDIPVNHTMQGQSLLPLIEGRAPEDFNKYVFTGTYNKKLFYPFPEYMAIRTNEWKLIHIFDAKSQTVIFELYNLKEDLKEQHNLIQEYPQVFSDLKNRLYQWHSVSKNLAPEDIIKMEHIETLKEKLRNFGYWWLGEELDPRKISEQKK